MCTIAKLIEILKAYPEDWKVINHEGESYIHTVNIDENKVILSTKAPIGCCKNCGDYVYPSTKVKNYTGVCPTCDENFYDFEIEPLPIKESEE